MTDREREAEIRSRLDARCVGHQPVSVPEADVGALLRRITNLRCGLRSAHRQVRQANRRAGASVELGALIDSYEGREHWPVDDCDCEDCRG